MNDEVMELTNSRLVFFTNISHELRTPLTLIADPVEMLLEDNSIKGKARDLLKMVQRNALALQQLVGSILDFRKIQNGKMDLELYRFDLVKALTLWTNDFLLAAERKHIMLHLDVEEFKRQGKIVADKEKIARVVFNLLSNALKYTPAGGDIFVSLKMVDPHQVKGLSAETINSYKDFSVSMCVIRAWEFLMKKLKRCLNVSFRPKVLPVERVSDWPLSSRLWSYIMARHGWRAKRIRVAIL